MTIHLLATIIIFILLLIIGIPISLVLAITSLAYLILTDSVAVLGSVPQKMFSGLDNFGLLAIPLFMLAGELMNLGASPRD